MEAAQRLSSIPTVRAHAVLGLSMVRFLAWEPRLPRTNSAMAAGLSGSGRTAVSGSRSISLVSASGTADSPVRTARTTHAGISSILASR
jgi:hypothetical protein